METRVLTLFDDDDFFSQEETPKKTAKKTGKGKDNDQVTDTTDTVLFPEPTQALTVAQQIEQENTNITAEPEQSETTLPSSPLEEAITPKAGTELPEVIVPVTPAADILTPEAEAAIPETTEEPVTVPVTLPLIELRPEEDELGKQLLQELIQQDYASLIHKDYPFDIQQASVVKKEKELKPTQAEALAEEEVAEEEEVFEEVVPLPEWNLDKKYYTIGEVAQLFAVNTSHIRFWTNEFKLKPRTTRKGDRLYSPKDIAELRLIHHLVKEKKHTIKGAREKLKTEKTGVNHKLDLKESLTSLKDMLIRIKEQL